MDNANTEHTNHGGGEEEPRGRFVGVSDAEREALIADIHRAFGQVTLGRGYSWNECVAIDNYEDDDACLAARATDAHRSWQELVDDPAWQPFLSYGGFSFQNVEGFTHYFPPTMIRFLRGDVSDWYPEHLLEVMDRFIRHAEIILAQSCPVYTPFQFDCIARFAETMVHYIATDDVPPPEWDYALIWGAAYETKWKTHKLTDEARAALRMSK